MEVEAAVNRLEALVEKVDSDLNYTMEKLGNEFSEAFKDHMDNDINPVKLIERIQKVKEEFKTLAREAEQVELEQKKMTKALCAAMLEPMNRIHDVQLQAGIQPSQKPNEDLHFLSKQCEKPDREEDRESLFSNLEDNCKDHQNPGLVRATSKEFVPVTEQEFMGVSDLVRGRSKLQDVNKVYESLFGYFKKSPKSSLTVKDMTKMGLKVTGATGGAKLKVLRTLKIIRISKQGAVEML